ncbi:MAG: hypothetical protein KIS92_15180 [Planctomycetota bacterium]|nr:hypothetical protein [Planctomycetota bacterium]
MNSETRHMRLLELTGALMRAVHAGQIHLQHRAKTPGDPALYAPRLVTLEQAERLRIAGERLAALPSEHLVAWAHGHASSEAGRLVAALACPVCMDDPRLPVNVMRTFLEANGVRDEPAVRATANLFQLLMEVHRDGDWLQDLFRVYLCLGLPVSLSQLGLAAGDADLERYGRELSPLIGASPFETTPLAVHMILKKLEMWGEKNSGRRDKFAIAHELLDDPAVTPLLPALKALPPKRVAVFGHSMTMSLHWATHGSWIEIACEVMRHLQPKTQYRGFQTGGMVAVNAEKWHMANILNYKPTETVMLMVVGSENDQAAYERMIPQLKDAGSAVWCVDDVRPFLDGNYITYAEAHLPAVCEKTGARMLAFNQLGKQAPGWEKWQALGGDIHSVTASHIFYAKEMLKVWARPA